MLADGLDIGGFGQEGAHHRPVALGMHAEIAERIGVATFDDRIGLGRQFTHYASPVSRRRNRPTSGKRSHSGRCASSYSISRTAFSSEKKSTMALVACRSAGHSRAFGMG